MPRYGSETLQRSISVGDGRNADIDVLSQKREWKRTSRSEAFIPKLGTILQRHGLVLTASPIFQSLLSLGTTPRRRLMATQSSDVPDRYGDVACLYVSSTQSQFCYDLHSDRAPNDGRLLTLPQHPVPLTSKNNSTSLHHDEGSTSSRAPEQESLQASFRHCHSSSHAARDAFHIATNISTHIGLFFPFGFQPSNAWHCFIWPPSSAPREEHARPR
jgi:hypothetical protein